jgi:hypothetical protein
MPAFAVMNLARPLPLVWFAAAQPRSESGRARARETRLSDRQQEQKLGARGEAHSFGISWEQAVMRVAGQIV